MSKKIEQPWDIRSEVSLVGRVRELSMMQLRHHPGQVMDAVHLGMTFVIKRGRSVVAIIQRPPADMTITVDKNGKFSYSL